MIRAITVITADANGNFNYYCRQCTRYITQEVWPDKCPECGNIEVEHGFGCSGDAGVSNTTETRLRKSATFLGCGTIDIRRG